MKIAVIGTGYVGLVTGTCFAETGVNVVCVDNDLNKIQLLKNGKVPIFEPGLEPMLVTNIEKGRLSFAIDIKEAIIGAEVIFIAVGTPPGEDGSADLKHVLSVASDIGKYINHYVVVATKSTVPVGTAEKVRYTIKRELDIRKSEIPFDVASNPEFLKEGSAIEDFLKPQRIIVGVDNEKAGEIMKRLYMPFLMNNRVVIFMDIPSAELTKYAANAMLATRISFINEIANLCELLGADINSVRKGIGSDSRIGNRFIYPGAGYGGSCFPKDVKAILKTSSDLGYDLMVVSAVEKANEYQKTVIFNKLDLYFKHDLKGRVVTVWGLSFKPKTDDIRESSAVFLVKKLLEAGVKVRAYDPVAMEEAKKHVNSNFINSIYYAEDPYDALKGADALALMTEWPEFHLPDFDRMSGLMKGLVIFDGRNIYDPEELREKGFEYFGIGRK
jgi:UDPglucose 6-dehydrogenase